MLTHGFTVHFPGLLSWGGLVWYVALAWVVGLVRIHFKRP